MITMVKTKYGYLKGTTSNGGFALFKGVPYAKAPVGQLRWKAPQEPDCYSDVLQCDKFGPACTQYDRWSTATDDITDDAGHPYIKKENYPYPPKMSEDCLYLNIYTPAKSDNERLPVCFYIHGGGLQQWYGSDYEYCGDQFCQEGCILVTITYRLNVFGFFACQQLDDEDEYHSSGNYGLLDQAAALKWVYENIAAFGGDKDRIMVFGQSAGGGSALALLCSPLANRYIARVSLQSCGGITSLMREANKTEIFAKGEKLMKACGCDTVEQMRQLDANYLRDKNDELFGMFGGFMFNIDGYVLPYACSDVLNRGLQKDVEIIAGCTVDEGGNMKEPMFGSNMCASVVALAKKQLENNKKPIYSYVFARSQPGDDVGVPHSCDNRYQFGSLDGSWRPYEAGDYELSRKMTKYWANFARCGNPNGDGLEEWTVYTSNNHRQLKLDIDKIEMFDFNLNTEGNVDKLSDEILASLRRSTNV